MDLTHLDLEQICDCRAVHFSLLVGAQVDQANRIYNPTTPTPLSVVDLPPPSPTMRRISPLFLYAYLALAADNSAFWNLQLTSDVSQRYTINGQMVSIHTAFSLNPSPSYLIF